MVFKGGKPVFRDIKVYLATWNLLCECMKGYSNIYTAEKSVVYKKLPSSLRKLAREAPHVSTFGKVLK